MAAGQLERRFPSRLFSACLGALLVFAAIVGGLLHLTGAANDDVFLYLGLAAGCIVLASLAWEVVVRQALRRAGPSDTGPSDTGPSDTGITADPPDSSPGDGPPGVIAWMAFPVAIFLGLASLPLLALVVYPPAAEYFTEPGRVTASISRSTSGLLLDLDFPEPTTERGENLRINGQPLPEGYQRDHPDVFVWRGAQTLSLRLEPLLRDLGIERIERIGINQLAGVLRFTYLNGMTVPQQRVVVSP